MTKLDISAALLSDVGCHREANEDRATLVLPDEHRRGGFLAVVADGMGGHAAGEVASELAVQVVRRAYLACSGEPERCLVGAVTEANRTIFENARSDERFSGMGTTCTSLVVENGQGYLAHVGDSRLYLVRGDGVYRMTEDHSAVMDMVRRGLLTVQEAKEHGDKNVILRALGTHASVEVATWDQPLPLHPGDAVVLCSDGLHDLVDDEEILAAVRGGGPEQACREMVELARSRSAPDNVTVVVARFDGEGAV